MLRRPITKKRQSEVIVFTGRRMRTIVLPRVRQPAQQFRFCFSQLFNDFWVQHALGRIDLKVVAIDRQDNALPLEHRQQLGNRIIHSVT